ncbi:RcpC/CpaB family pilus assembly protein [Lysinibacillus sphaericus]|uniref:RcpC/CpaB family pilus assembly protein n=1 Tax=Lysinibacillus sphaericus TaxID=1421 RepID=UPI003F78F9AE
MKRTTKIITVVSLATVVGLGFSFGTKWEVDRQIAPIETYFTAEEIAAGTEITEDMLLPMEITSKAIPPNAITDKEQIVGKFVKNGYNVPPNSYFYVEVISTENDMPNSSVLKLKEGEYAFPLLVDLETSLGNGILPDSKVDLAFRTTIDDGNGEEKVIYGSLATDVRVTSVKDSNATAVFKDEAGFKSTDGNKKADSMSKLYTFAVSEELNDLLSKAAKLGEIRPVAKGQTEETSNTETTLNQNEVVTYILNNSLLAKDNQKKQILSQKKQEKDTTADIVKNNKTSSNSSNKSSSKNDVVLSDEEEALIQKYSNN